MPNFLFFLRDANAASKNILGGIANWFEVFKNEFFTTSAFIDESKILEQEYFLKFPLRRLIVQNITHSFEKF